jgi:hypothetical protein
MLGLGVHAPVADPNPARSEHPRRGRRGQNWRAIDAPVEDAPGFVESFEREDMVWHGESMAPPPATSRTFARLSVDDRAAILGSPEGALQLGPWR